MNPSEVIDSKTHKDSDEVSQGLDDVEEVSVGDSKVRIDI